MKNKKTKIIILSILAAVLVAGIIAVSLFFAQFAPVDKNDKETVRFEIPYGSNAHEVINSLYDNGLIKNKKFFYYLILRPKYLKFVYPKTEFPKKLDFKSGVYKVNKSMSYADFILKFASGDSEYVVITVPEGLTIKKIGKLLEEKGICSKDGFVDACHNPDLLSIYDIPADSFEGYLFPDTYNLDAIMKPELIVQIMADNFFNKIKEIPELEGKHGKELNQIVTLASIVEREYKVDEEAPVIASVFSNRIKKHIGLYSCATVEYVITEILDRPHPERIFEKDLKIDNPYNTYLYEGLTPGPISNPGTVALAAAAKPAKTEYFYFQVVDPSSGKHVFTKTFDEHIINHTLISK